jgi:hypothetical protein
METSQGAISLVVETQPMLALSGDLSDRCKFSLICMLSIHDTLPPADRISVPLAAGRTLATHLPPRASWRTSPASSWVPCVSDVFLCSLIGSDQLLLMARHRSSMHRKTEPPLRTLHVSAEQDVSTSPLRLLLST